MSCMDVTISEDSGGWFVTAHSKMGPYISKDQALNLAGGMVEAMVATGTQARLFLLDGGVRRPLTVDRAPNLQAPRLGWTGAPSVFGRNPFAADADPEPASPPLQLRVLCAETGLADRRRLAEVLELSGIACATVENGVQAVAAWAREPWDVILMDIHMPVMDGLAATREIRAREARTGRLRTPILALASDALPHQVAACLGAEMDALVAKPFEVTELLAQMGAALDAVAASRAHAAGMAVAGPPARRNRARAG